MFVKSSQQGCVVYGELVGDSSSLRQDSLVIVTSCSTLTTLLLDTLTKTLKPLLLDTNNTHDLVSHEFRRIVSDLKVNSIKDKECLIALISSLHEQRISNLEFCRSKNATWAVLDGTDQIVHCAHKKKELKRPQKRARIEDMFASISGLFHACFFGIAFDDPVDVSCVEELKEKCSTWLVVETKLWRYFPKFVLPKNPVHCPLSSDQMKDLVDSDATLCPSDSKFALIRDLDAFADSGAGTSSQLGDLFALEHSQSLVIIPMKNLQRLSSVLIDEYERTNGSFFLTRSGVVLSNYLHDHLGLDIKISFGSVSKDSLSRRQSSSQLVMIAPSAFEFNESSATDNSFMQQVSFPNIRKQAMQEHAEMVRQLRKYGIIVNLFSYASQHGTPDACFPNNWFSTHSQEEVGERTLVLYPMKSPNRRAERRSDIVDWLKRLHFKRVLDLTSFESRGLYLEGTGSLVLDRIHKIAYMAKSERSHVEVAHSFASELGYELVAFESFDKQNRPIYHTNVLMSICSGIAFICLESIKDQKERLFVYKALEKHRFVKDLTFEQIQEFSGNVLEVEDAKGLPVLALSRRAFLAFSPVEIVEIRNYFHDIVPCDFETVETVGGGGVRCAIAELF